MASWNGRQRLRWRVSESATGFRCSGGCLGCEPVIRAAIEPVIPPSTMYHETSDTLFADALSLLRAENPYFQPVERVLRDLDPSRHCLPFLLVCLFVSGALSICTLCTHCIFLAWTLPAVLLRTHLPTTAQVSVSAGLRSVPVPPARNEPGRGGVDDQSLDELIGLPHPRRRRHRHSFRSRIVSERTRRVHNEIDHTDSAGLHLLAARRSLNPTAAMRHVSSPSHTSSCRAPTESTSARTLPNTSSTPPSHLERSIAMQR